MRFIYTFSTRGNGVLRVFLRWESVFVRAASAACAVGKGLVIAVTLLDDVFISSPVSFSVTLLDEEPLVCFPSIIGNESMLMNPVTGCNASTRRIRTL